MNKSNFKIVEQFLRFISVGAFNTVASLIVILALSELFHVWYPIANALGYAFGLGLGFILHRNITFKQDAGAGETKTQFIKFILVFLVSYTLQLIALIFMVQILEIHEVFAQIAAVGFYSVINFWGNRKITFTPRLKE